ncbi:methylenetetrahydrofolate reductase [NAD(P)H] [Brevundimonas sp. 2R-24]|uniref:Methylenetetrahydrofolate reductase n=1 Tax=Peiella sedimenti TaxID=3061083 RepID=A0ABT8SKK9_9CAUL|nr:methylenetetrahydrofolate reductase [NAD(P)H] [Caulobacteraceae bacterium XZ-24]
MITLPLHDAVGPVARAAGRQRSVAVSFEFFPPRDEAAEGVLWNSLRKLEPLNPSFVSVTYGAGGSTRERTHRTIQRILGETGLTPAAHVTCVDASREQVDEVLRDYWEAGVRHLVCLRGDPPGGASLGGAYAPGPGSYANATELTEAAARIAPFEISVGVYPEKHPESPSIDHDIDVLKAKIDAGATRAITQFFFDIDAFLRFHDRVRAAGVTIPIVPGIMPVSNYQGLKRMAAGCQTALPAWLASLFEGLDDDPDIRRLLAASVACEMSARLEEEGFSAFHFYTLNRAELVYAICRMLGVRQPLKASAE